MRYWEFLIQQEGDQTWLPLETRQVEILEGRYRMAAHTSYEDTAVEVRVSQLRLDEIPPRRRLRKRKSLTNDSGLLAIFPFIQLSPGRWEIDCNSSDVMDDLLGDGWQYSVQLQVVARDEDDWAPDWSGAAATAQEDSPAAAPRPEGTAAMAKNLADGKLDQLEEKGQESETDFQVKLRQQAYVTQLDQPLILIGQLSRHEGSPLSNAQLWVQLRDPQTAKILREMAFVLPKQILPSPFSVTVSLPGTLATQVILGAISLVNQDGRTLASASFTVTTGLAQMLDAIANQSDLEFDEEISIFPGSTESFVPPAEKSEALLTHVDIFPKELVPSEGLTLPPQIKKPNTDTDRPPELPAFGRSETPKADVNTTDEVLDSSTTEELKPELDSLPEDTATATLETETDIPPDVAAAFVQPQIVETGSIEDDDLDLELATAALDPENHAPAIEPLSTILIADSNSSIQDAVPTENLDTDDWDPITINIDQAFQKLHLQERFWEKLTLLTQDGYRQSLEVKRALEPSQNPLPIADPFDVNLQSNEFVVYEQPVRLEPAKEASTTHDPIQVMTPSLDIPNQELVAGDWIPITVRVPMGSYRPYVKVWMNDLQTRTVIEAPRLLMQFTPNDSNEYETLMRIRIPDGCLELQFAAIAIDMSTLQESRKVVQNRRVMPPDDSLAVFDDF